RLIAQHTRMENVAGAATIGVEIERATAIGNRFQRVSVFPFFSADDIVGDVFLEELRLFAGLQRPVVPLSVQLVHIQQTGVAELQSADFFAWRASARMIPWADDQILFVASCG